MSGSKVPFVSIVCVRSTTGIVQRVSIALHENRVTGKVALRSRPWDMHISHSGAAEDAYGDSVLRTDQKIGAHY